MNRRKQTMILCMGTALLLIGIFLYGLFIPEEAYAVDFSAKNLAPCREHLFGTDWLGRDMLARTIKGLSISMMIGLCASIFSSIIAVLVGMTAGLSGKKLDGIVGWFIDLIMGIPHLILIVLISFLMGRGAKGLIIGIILTHWCSLARIIRAEVLQIKRESYIEVSVRFGKSKGWILRHHLLPHVIPQLIIGFVLMFPHAILHESSATFLGFGLSPEQPAIGIILSESMSYLTGGMWWLAMLPGMALLVIVLLFDLLGEQLKQLLDPYHAQE